MEQIKVKKPLESIFGEIVFLFKQMKKVIQGFLILSSKNKRGGNHVI
jgi:hypothetical protein